MIMVANEVVASAIAGTAVAVMRIAAIATGIVFWLKIGFKTYFSPLRPCGGHNTF